MTFAPFAANLLAVANPKPALAPVMATLSPFKSKFFSKLNLSVTKKVFSDLYYAYNEKYVIIYKDLISFSQTMSETINGGEIE